MVRPPLGLLRLCGGGRCGGVPFRSRSWLRAPPSHSTPEYRRRECRTAQFFAPPRPSCRRRRPAACVARRLPRRRTVPWPPPTSLLPLGDPTQERPPSPWLDGKRHALTLRAWPGPVLPVPPVPGFPSEQSFSARRRFTPANLPILRDFLRKAVPTDEGCSPPRERRASGRSSRSPDLLAA
jgi:hypothetical protein